MHRAEADGTLVLPTSPPTSPTAPAPLVARLALARETYLRRVDGAYDVEHVRPMDAVAQVELLYLHGYFDEARRRAWDLWIDGCAGGHDGPTPAEASRMFERMLAMADALDDADERTRLENGRAARTCPTER